MKSPGFCLKRAAGSMFAMWLLSGFWASAHAQMERIAMATVSSSDLAAFEHRYSRWLHYHVRERGTVPDELAQSWGAPAVAGKSYILMSPDSHPDVYLRAVELPAVSGHVPLTTWGWNSIEIIVDDPGELRKSIEASPFRVIGEPKPLNSYPTIVAFQVEGPDGEVLYLTAETGDRQKSILPPPGGDVGRIFIMVVASHDLDGLLDWYSASFGLARGVARQIPIGVVQRAQGLSEKETVGISVIRLSERGNLIELDGYSAARSGPRPFRAGELPPGIAMSTFQVPSIEALDLPFITPPRVQAGAAYGGKRSATVRGPIGELVELIESSPESSP